MTLFELLTLEGWPEVRELFVEKSTKANAVSYNCCNDVETYREIDKQTDRQIDRQTDRQTDRQIDRQTDRQTD